MPRLALCIPAYNATSFLPRLLRSAEAQTKAFDEIWVYDDASTDQTAELAQSLGANVIRGENNAGCSHGKNVLAAATHCDWIHFHDADDALEPNFVTSAQPWINGKVSVDVVLFSYRAIDDTTGAPLYVRTFDDTALRSDPVAYCLTEQINPFCGLYRRTAFLNIGGWNENPAVLPSEDQAGHLRMALNGLRFAHDPTVTVINHIRGSSMTTGNPQRCPRAELAFLTESLPLIEPRLYTKLSRRLWKIAGASGAFLDWETAHLAIALARRLTSGAVPEGSTFFRCVARHFPRLALHLREQWVRFSRPSLRSHPACHPQTTAIQK